MQVTPDSATLDRPNKSMKACAEGIRNKNNKKIFKCELSFKKLRKYIVLVKKESKRTKKKLRLKLPLL